jgi:hypothetical protein
MKRLLINIFLLSAISGTAQTFTHSLSIASKQNGLQALAINPKLKNIANTGFNDVRIYDKQQNEVPYFLVNESFNYSSANFKEYEISDKETGKDKYTNFIVLNPKKETIQNIVLCAANSDAVKVCNVVGSDDKKQWYSVSDGIVMYNLYDQGSVYVYRTLYFPPVNYKYVKIEINDLHTLPLNILKVGYFEGAISAGKLNEVAPVEYKYNTDKEKKASLGVFKFEDRTTIDKISFRIKSPTFYKRQASIYAYRTRTVKQKEERYKEVLFEFELNSETNNSFNLTNFREKEFDIEISNADNPPLEFEWIKFEQLQTYLVADFRQGESYSLLAGNKKLNVPNYDIEYFKNKISQYLPTLEVSELNRIPVATVEIKIPERKLWQEPWFMWACIAVASFMLFLFSIRILKDMKK